MHQNGRLWKKFRVEGRIDVGGMAEILRVRDDQGQVFAAKVLRKDRMQKSARFVEQFKHEVVIHPTIKHINIVPCHKTFDGPPGLLLAYIEGGTVRHWMKTDKSMYSDSNGIMQMLSQLTDALTYLHNERGIVHCDLKPENILIDRRQNRFLLTDFGISQPLGQPLTSQRGTPKYMAPEQYLSKVVDARTDVYSLGITMYEILTGGKPPFTTKEDDSAVTDKQRALEHLHINVRPPRPSYLRRSIRPEIDDVLLRALEKNPKDRYDTVEAFFGALHAAFSHSSQNLSMSATDGERNIERLRHATPKAYLVCTTGQVQEPVQLEPITLVGRKKECNVRLRDSAISRRHAMVEWNVHRHCFQVYDQGSLIGTRVNGRLLQGARTLNRGDVITIGSYNFRFEE